MLHLYAADRVEPLADQLAEVFLDRPADPLAPEWVAVPSVGMRRWLSLALARQLGAGDGRGDGVAANINFGFPGQLRSRVFEAGRTDGSPDPWTVARLTWTVLAVADRYPDDPHLHALTRPAPGVARFGVARRMADLLDRYHVHRPEMVRRWARGDDVDGAGRTLDAHLRWQPHLWRRCRALIDEASPAELLPDLLARLRHDDLELDLPDRLAVFGLTQLPGGPGFVDLAGAVGAHRDLHVLLLEPSTRIRAHLSSANGPGTFHSLLRSEDTSIDQVHHPLLRSWGRQHRETAVLLDDARRRDFPVPVDLTGPDTVSATPSLLHRLQADLRADRAPAGDHPFDPADDSVRIHACFGATRQVEVLRDALLHLLADDTLDLIEDDIVVLCPDLETFAPLLTGVFGTSEDRPPEEADDPTRAPSLRYRIADRSIGTTNPVLKAVTDLVALLAGRFDAASVLDFLASSPVRHRFGFTDDDLARITGWVDDTRIRWGIDARHRLAFGVPAGVAGNTWRAGLDRLLVGTAVHGDDLTLAVGEVAPFDASIEDPTLLGRLAEIVDTLDRLQQQTGTARPIAGWTSLVAGAATDLVSVEPDQQWQLDQLGRTLAQVVEDSSGPDGGSSSTGLTFADLRRILDYELRSSPGRPNFFRGGITVTSTTPLRGLPARVVCLLGMDEGAGGTGTVDGDDLLAAAPRIGDRDPRADARQALLEAVLSAGDRLVVVRTGFDVQKNQPTPPSVVVAELLDALDATLDPTHRTVDDHRLEVVHPRQPYDPGCFTPDPVTGQPWSFDPVTLAGARVRLHRHPGDIRPFLNAPLAPAPPGDIALDDLQRFFRHPVQHFLEQRLGVRLPRSEDRHEPVVPLDLSGLEQWGAGDRLLTALLDGASADRWATFERRLGTLPPGALSDAVLEDVRSRAEELYTAAVNRRLVPGPGEPVPVDVTLDDGTRVTGSVLVRLAAPGVGPCRVTYSRAKPEHRVAAWLDLVALAATDPDTTWRSVAIGRKEQGPSGTRIVELFPADDPLDAARGLEVAVDLYRRGMTEPIPLFARLSEAVADHRHRPTDWRDFDGRGDGDDDHNAFVYGRYDFDELMALEATDADPAGSGPRVERYAASLWETIRRTSKEPAGPKPTRGSGS